MKDKIILVHYIAIGNMEHNKAMMALDKFKNQMKAKEEDVVQYFIGIREGDSRIECINPKLVDEAEYAKAREALDKAQSEFNKLLNELKDESSEVKGSISTEIVNEDDEYNDVEKKEILNSKYQGLTPLEWEQKLNECEGLDNSGKPKWHYYQSKLEESIVHAKLKIMMKRKIKVDKSPKKPTPPPPPKDRVIKEGEPPEKPKGRK